MEDSKESPRTPAIIIAGASGLVGSECLSIISNLHTTEQIYTLNRRQLPLENTKITQLISSDLNITAWDHSIKAPELGIIALGTTIKQAGSKQALEKVDFELVCHVARQMKVIGVQRLAVVSSYGAHSRSKSHYLRCKGRMEEATREMGFNHVTFVRPGPLAGTRAITRTDEIWLQRAMKVGQYFMFGPLRNLIPIQAKDVAQAMVYSLLDKNSHNIKVLNSIEIKAMLKKFS